MNDLRRIALEAGLIFLLGSVIGLSLHFRVVMKAFQGESGITKISADAGSSYPSPASLAEVEHLLETGAVAVDARSGELFAEGHIAGAVSLPLEEAEERIPAFLEAHPPGTLLVVYCGGFGCPDSFDLAVRLAAEGFSEIRVFEGGFPEWRDAGLPVEESP